MERYVLLLCGTVAVVIAALRSVAIARQALVAAVHEGDPTRSALEATRAFPFRPRVQRVAGRAAVSLGWLVVAAYGLFLVLAGLTVAR